MDRFAGVAVGTVDRSRLDFDFEKLCSISLQNANVYACIVCGKVPPYSIEILKELKMSGVPLRLSPLPSLVFIEIFLHLTSFLK